MLENQIAGRNDSWVIRWYASALLASKFTLYPGQSLVRNIGNDGSGTHGGATNRFDGNLAQQAPDLSGLVSGLVVEKSAAARSAFERHFQERDGRSPVRPLDLLMSRMLQNLSRMVLRRVRK